MLIRIIQRSLVRRRQRKMLSALAVALGITVATVVGTMMLDVGDRINRELRSFGANISVTPAADGLPVEIGGIDYRPAGAGAFLRADDLAKIKTIFWRNNIVAFAPFLYLPATVQGRRAVIIGTWFHHAVPVNGGEVFETGVRDLHPTWQVRGRWPSDGDLQSCLVGQRLARALHLRPGDAVRVSVGGTVPPAFAAASKPSTSVMLFEISGMVETGGPEEDQIFAPLETVQRLAGQPGKVRRVEVSALTKPEDDFARRDPSRMSPEELERWSCSPYVRSIAYQIQQAIPGSVAQPVLPVAETEGKILNRVGALMGLLAAAALITAALAVASMMLANVFERRAEIGLYKSLGATDARVALIFLLEASVVGVAGGTVGYFAGSALAWRLAIRVFGAPAGIHWAILPAVLLLALVVTWVGSAGPLARGLKAPAAAALRN
jgi:putative ABC transport system permease protein